jgi:hypothetical protein
MPKQLQRQPLLKAQAVSDLRHAKQEILEAVAGKVPERLVLATVGAALRLARREATPAEVLSKRVCGLVRDSLMALAQEKWKPDTALVLLRRLGEGRHGLTQ